MLSPSTGYAAEASFHHCNNQDYSSLHSVTKKRCAPDICNPVAASAPPHPPAYVDQKKSHFFFSVSHLPLLSLSPSYLLSGGVILDSSSGLNRTIMLKRQTVFTVPGRVGAKGLEACGIQGTQSKFLRDCSFNHTADISPQ